MCSANASSILLFTEGKMPRGNFLKRLSPCTVPEMLISESKTL